MTTVEIERLGQYGDGVAPGPVFAALSLPGETVSGTLVGDRLMDVRVETPSSNRVSAPCPHFKSCGGCQLQHASDLFVAGWKREVVQIALKRHGITTDVLATVTSPDRSRRRATFSACRTKKGALAGLHARKSDAIIPVPSCVLMDASLLTGLPVAEALAKIGGSRKGALSVTVTKSLDGLDVAVTGSKSLERPLRIELSALCETNNLARLTWDGEVIAMRHPPYQKIGCARVIPPPGAFLQATEHGQNALTEKVRSIVGDAKFVVDLFAGCGTFSLPLSEDAEVHAVEGSGDMMAALDRGWREASGLKTITTEARDLFRRPLLSDELSRFDAAVVDPPRAGAAAQISELAAAQIPRVAYVSCNPSTFSRDAEVLCASGYLLDWVQPVDQFRWSTHVELVGAFRQPHIRA